MTEEKFRRDIGSQQFGADATRSESLRFGLWAAGQILTTK